MAEGQHKPNRRRARKRGLSADARKRLAAFTWQLREAEALTPEAEWVLAGLESYLRGERTTLERALDRQKPGHPPLRPGEGKHYELAKELVFARATETPWGEISGELSERGIEIEPEELRRIHQRYAPGMRVYFGNQVPRYDDDAIWDVHCYA